MDKTQLAILKKPSLETIQPSVGSSFTVKKFTDKLPNDKPVWHFHPELELVYIENGSGKRHVGHHFSYYSSGDLILIGPNLPHYGFTERFSENQREIVVQFAENFLGDNFIQSSEMSKIRLLFEKSKQGLSFFGRTMERIGNMLDQMTAETGFQKLMSWLNILHELSHSDEHEYLNAYGISLEIENSDNDRINSIFNFVRDRFKEPIPLDTIARDVNMTVPAFCRYFKKQTHQTFTQFVNQFRVVHACKLLVENNTSITEICFECGFNNLSHFNKHFKKIIGKTPRKYRSQFRKIIRS